MWGILWGILKNTKLLSGYFNILGAIHGSNSGSHKNQRLTSALPSKKIGVFRRGATMVPDWLGLVELAQAGRALASLG